jgi:hypothetical protein
VPTVPDDADCLLEAWREALGDVLDTERRQWQRERMLIEAQAQATIAELRAMIAERLGALKDGESGAPGGQGPPVQPGRRVRAARMPTRPCSRPSRRAGPGACQLRGLPALRDWRAMRRRQG